jgi:hypothetical protein
MNSLGEPVHNTNSTELCINLVQLSIRPEIGILEGAINMEYVLYVAKIRLEADTVVRRKRDLGGPDFGQKVYILRE